MNQKNIEGHNQDNILQHTMNIIREFEKKPNLEEQKILVKGFLDGLINIMANVGGIYHQDVNEIYSQFRNEKLLVRREDPRKVVSFLSNKQDLPITFDKNVGEQYANCAEWSYEEGVEGLRNAFIEGHTHLGGLVTVLGFKKGKDLTISDIPEYNKEWFGLNRRLVRSAEGIVHQQDIQFITIRIPITLVSEHMLTADEQEKFQADDVAHRKSNYIFRGFTFPNHKEN